MTIIIKQQFTSLFYFDIKIVSSYFFFSRFYHD